jgi:cell division protein FtsL
MRLNHNRQLLVETLILTRLLCEKTRLESSLVRLQLAEQASSAASKRKSIARSAGNTAAVKRERR